MLKKMGEAVARVARKVNETVESGSDTLDLAECKLVSFPVGIYKVLRNVSDQIHLITLANNELKSLTSKFMTTFSQLRELHLEGNFLHRLPTEVGSLQHLKVIDLSRNQFQDFPEQLTTLPSLETINLEENEIVADVPVEKLAAMPALRSVNLRSNPLNAEMSAAEHLLGLRGLEALFLVLRANGFPERSGRQPSTCCFLRTEDEAFRHAPPSPPGSLGRQEPEPETREGRGLEQGKTFCRHHAP
ncbi:leucine-rich repeat-containing protein 20 isoform X1 [Marmota marmota marmota]|uniref:leucine-rich repeat-containing protein 20 isoform X1 n=2 Tax=Marmota marmota marmota TaxID=9994 RepID=UPI002093840B|nr:leucine-rich repeat-containing protein 20 isoform X1 [Marmota marmota marmota]XP_048665428.1 leucine-rich repeat-containing protein 20 isoform X1 [Marmota marmota marmota]XP_048665432.1 leucine-rich repeat-containing protein 20 isoform X1 [Marmota marmota marmota]XP_048665442.1 leucine-rich repeat-containing protein 20 isoform X1 [Marmota marmota marmota]XP_048665451.1 leucine-rich repeat-containing protein 20 isoform X1 [Marmota marmota marmota]